ncbi:MAG TPA: nucleoside-triphosphatase [Candidatus Heimdallarchaeota archaeon]|nr:nucleoside-triphosphatase [Candidatus Heimdallarchaeota archaeon]
MIHILKGPVHSGKTTMLQRVTAQLKRKNITVAGFLSLYTEDKGEFIGYDLYDLRRETRTSFIRKAGKNHWQKIGSYFFIPKSLDNAQKIIRRSKNADICVVDEVGPLELEGKGLWPALKKVIDLPSPDYVLVVRETILENWLGTLGETPVKIFDISDKELYPKMVQYFTMKDLQKRSS